MSAASLVVLIVFAATYVGMALGRVPGLTLDRTGIALIALAVLLASGLMDLPAFGAAIDAPTLILLFALMVVSAQFAGAGFYDRCAAAITRATACPAVLLALTVAIGGLLSAVLANDIVVFAMTPLLCIGIRGRGLDPRPFLIGLAGASNAGSAATLIGNPQNILIGQVGGLDFWHFIAVCGVPALVALVLVYAVTRVVWRRELAGPDAPVVDRAPVPLDRRQTGKGMIAVVALVILFATPVPREVSALGIAALLLVSRRMESRAMLRSVDWNLLLLFLCLFAVTAALANTGLAGEALAWAAQRGLSLDQLSVLTPATLLLSNTLGNVPAVFVIPTIWPDASQGALYALALLSTLAGNLLIVGSIANLIVAERAQAVGVRLGFYDFARAGIPMTLLSVAVAVLWLWSFGWLPW